jgi:hypothetical protein
MNRIRSILWTALAATLLVAVLYVIEMERAALEIEKQAAITIRETPDKLIAAIHAEGDATRMAAVSQIAATLARVDSAIALASDTETDAAWQIAGIRKDIRGIAGQLTAVVQAQGDQANRTLAVALNGEGGIIPAATSFLATYQRIPADLSAAPAWKSLEPEITCRTPTGYGYGGCMRARINGLLGEWERTGAQITKASPAFIGAATGIAVDVHTFTTKAVAPPTIKGRIWEALKVGSFVAGKVIP